MNVHLDPEGRVVVFRAPNRHPTHADPDDSDPRPPGVMKRQPFVPPPIDLLMAEASLAA